MYTMGLMAVWNFQLFISNVDLFYPKFYSFQILINIISSSYFRASMNSTFYLPIWFIPSFILFHNFWLVLPKMRLQSKFSNINISWICLWTLNFFIYRFFISNFFLIEILIFMATFLTWPVIFLVVSSKFLRDFYRIIFWKDLTILRIVIEDVTRKG